MEDPHLGSHATCGEEQVNPSGSEKVESIRQRAEKDGGCLLVSDLGL